MDFIFRLRNLQNRSGGFFCLLGAEEFHPDACAGPSENALLVVEVVSLAMHLVLQGEVEGDVLHPLVGEGLCAGFVFLLLDVFDHIWEPHRQAIVAAEVCRVRPLNIKPCFASRRYLKDMLNQTAISMNVVRLYSGRKQAMMLFRICGVKNDKEFCVKTRNLCNNTTAACQ